MKTADVCVVGAGMTGCAAALELAKRGQDVVVLEATTVAGGASGQNLGHIATGLGCHYPSAVADLGHENAREIWETHRANHARLAELVAEVGPCGYEQRGGLQVAASREEAAELADGEDLLRDDGFSGEFLDHYMLEARFDVQGFAGAYWAADDAEIDSAAFTRGLARAAEHAGARILEARAVVSLESGPAEAVAHTAQGPFRARTALVALDAYAGRLVPFLAERIRPLRGQCLAIGGTGALRIPSPAYADHGRVYWRTNGEELLVGGFDDLALAEESTDELGTTPLIQQAIEDFARRHLGVGDRPVVRRWSGIMGISLDGYPFIGRIPGTSLVAAAGFTGLGFGYALLAAQWAAETIVTGRDVTPTRYQAARPFQPKAWPPWNP